MNHYAPAPGQGAGITEADIQGQQDALADLTESADALTAEARRARAWDAYAKADEGRLVASLRADRIAEHVTELTEQLDAASGALATAEASQAAQAQAEARQATRRQAEERLAGLEADEAAFKAARLAWDAGVKGVMGEALRGVLEVCQTFTEGLFASPLTVHNLELGVYQDATWIPMDAFSGSDRRIACAAIQAALAANHQGFKLAIIDEATTIDPERLPKVLANLVKACGDGLIDQALIMSNATVQGVPAEVNVIRLE